MYRSSALLILFAVLASAGCQQPTANSIDPDVMTLIGSQAAVDAVRDPERVQAWRLPQKSYFQESLEDYEILSGPVDVPDETATSLADLLLTSSSYEFDLAKGCEPDYGVRLQFAKGEETVDILFCFGCGQLQVYNHGQRGNGAIFDPSASQFAAILKKLYPDDDAIQSLE